MKELVKELVVLSGKGGTGKTSIVASLAALAEDKVIADCDVDAADLHLVLRPQIRSEEEFSGGNMAVLNKDVCTLCGECVNLCRFNAISPDIDIDQLSCEGCGVCAYFCPIKAIEMKQKIAGKWFISDTEFGPLVHARLGIAEDNSGKLVTKIKIEAEKIAMMNSSQLVLIDGSPGIGCPVIASITGANLILIVTEPSVSGLHDMRRVAELAFHFKTDTIVCINKYDINNQKSSEIESFCKDNNIDIVAKIPYDTAFTKAQLAAKSIVEYSDGNASQEIRRMWDNISNRLQ